MGSVLQFDKLTLRFGDNEPVVRDLSFQVGEGETVALVGESGSGKSVSALSVLRLLDERLVNYPRGPYSTGARICCTPGNAGYGRSGGAPSA